MNLSWIGLELNSVKKSLKRGALNKTLSEQVELSVNDYKSGEFGFV